MTDKAGLTKHGYLPDVQQSVQSSFVNVLSDGRNIEIKTNIANRDPLQEGQLAA